MKKWQEDFLAGQLWHAHEYLGALKVEEGYCFRVWAPHAAAVSVIGSFNNWQPDALPMREIGAGIWEAVCPNAAQNDEYKYLITTHDGREIYKADPYAARASLPPETNSRIYTPEYAWKDGNWRRSQARKNHLHSPMNIYEVHAGTWRTNPDGSPLNYGQLAQQLIPYVKDMGYTHIELMPLCEYPYGPSWGYQVTGYFAPTSRYGSPEGLMAFVDQCHAEGIGVIMDWVPAHFPKDAHGLYEFDGQCCYELEDAEMNEHPDWTTRIFDFGRGEVVSFLISSAINWIERYHFDGLRVDAVASMLYLDYGRDHYKPNRYGGKENLEAIMFLRELNRAAFTVKRGVIMIAEESTAFPLVTKPDYVGGLGFLFKWNMGWMNDILRYMSIDPLFRKGNHNLLTFQLTYAFSENFILPFSHDEVVHGKCSMIGKMYGDYDQKFDNLRALYAFQMAHPGKKLNFMGNEFAQFIEWNDKQELDWLLLDYERHRQMQTFVRDLNHFYLENAPLWQNDQDWNGFKWINPDDADNSVLSFCRRSRKGKTLVVVCNFCPVKREKYRIGLPAWGTYKPVLNSDDSCYGGKGCKVEAVQAEKQPMLEMRYSAEITLPPMSVVFFIRETK